MVRRAPVHRSRAGPALALVLLLAPALLAAPAAVAQQAPPEYTLVSVSRDGDVVTFGLRARAPHWEVVVSLREGDTRVGLPDQNVEWLSYGSVRNVSFTVRDSATSGTLHLTWQDGASWLTQEIGVAWPARPASAPAGEPRVLVMDAVWTGAGVNVTLGNVGDAPARDVLVSLEDADGRKTGRPFHRAVSSLAPGVDVILPFAFPAVVEDVTVVVEHANVTERVKVAVARPASGNSGGSTDAGAPNVTLGVDLPFKETEIGRTVDYALTLKNTGRVALVELAAAGLPDGYSARFFVGGTSVTRLFVDTNATRAITLTVTVPNAATEVDRTIDFAVDARVNGTMAATIPAGLAVRGVGKLEVVGGLDVSRLPPGGSATQHVTVKNTGSAPLFDVEVDARGPYGWSFSFEPRRLDRLDPDEEQAVTVTVRAPEIVGPGRYVADVNAKSGLLTSRALTVGMEVPESESSGDWTGVAFLVLIGAILGGAAWWKRRAT